MWSSNTCVNDTLGKLTFVRINIRATPMKLEAHLEIAKHFILDDSRQIKKN